MTRVGNQFVDHSIPDTYTFPINHLEESGFGKQRNIDSTGRSAPGLALIQQQGADSPMNIQISGTIMRPEQHQAFTIWWQRSKDHTIRFIDFAGHEYEVIILSYEAPRTWVYQNPQAMGTWMANCIIKWTMQMRVVKIHSGPWAVVTP